MSTNALENKGKIPNVARFCLGGFSGMASVCFTHPLELIKIRMQKSGELGSTRQYKTSFHAVYYAVRNEGVLALYNGLTASLLRQAVYQTTRLGTYTCLLDYASRRHGGRTSYCTKAVIGMTAGAIGGFVGVPADLAMVRMTMDGKLPPEQRHNYRNAIQALYRIAREEGPMAVWQGSEATLIRSVLAGAVTLGTYSQTKQLLMDSGYFKDGLVMYFTAGMISGMATACACVPADLAKTRVQDTRHASGGKGRIVYKNVLDVWAKTVKYEGFLSLWKGFGPYYFRIGPQTVILFVFLETFTQAYAKYVMKNDHLGRAM